MKVWTFSLLFFPVESIRQCFHIIRAAFPWGMPEPGTSGAPGAAPHPHLTRPSPGEPSPAAKPHGLFPVPIPLSCQAPSRPFALLKPGLPFSPPPNPRAKRELKQSPPRLFLSSHRWELCQHLQRSSIPFFWDSSSTWLCTARPGSAPRSGCFLQELLWRWKSLLWAGKGQSSTSPHPRLALPPLPTSKIPPEFWHSGKNAGAESTTTKKTAQRGTAPKNQPHPSTPST